MINSATKYILSQQAKMENRKRTLLVSRGFFNNTRGTQSNTQGVRNELKRTYTKPRNCVRRKKYIFPLLFFT